MRLENVKVALPQIGEELLLNKTLNMKLEWASLVDGTIIIESTYDKLVKCRFDNCKIISHVPLTIDHCYIDDHIGHIQQTERIDKDIPHAYIDSCYFNRCQMPEGDYGNNYIVGKPRGSNTSVKRDDE